VGRNYYKTIKYPQVVFDFTLPLFMIVCSATGMAHLKMTNFWYSWFLDSAPLGIKIYFLINVEE